MKRENEGWFFLQLNDQEQDKKEAPNISTGEFYQTGKSNSLLLFPSLPSKPLVIKGSGLFVSPGQKLLFYLKIPLTVQIYFSKNQPENISLYKNNGKIVTSLVSLEYKGKDVISSANYQFSFY